jgi:hypothetical protein
MLLPSPSRTPFGLPGREDFQGPARAHFPFSAGLLLAPVLVLRGGKMARYGKKAQQKVERAMRERKQGKLKSGRSGRKVTSRKQAIAIGLAEARREGGKVPRKSSSKKK